MQKEEMMREIRGERIWKTSGIGVWTYDLDPQVEIQKAAAWRDSRTTKSDWLTHARARTEAYSNGRGLKPLLMWKLVERGSIPEDALPIGKEEDGKVLFAARSWWDGGLHVGK